MFEGSYTNIENHCDNWASPPVDQTYTDYPCEVL